MCGRWAARYCHVGCAFSHLYDFALIFEISVSYMIRYPCRWHLAWILRRIIARKKRSQYCHVIKKRAAARGITWGMYNAHISPLYVRGGIASVEISYRKIIEILKSQNHWDILNVTESFADPRDSRLGS